jgi:hypothetical protein
VAEVFVLLMETIAERRLTLINGTGAVREVVVRIGKPERSPDHADFACECEIVGLGADSLKRIHGLDAFQSLQLTLRFISSMLNHYRKESDGRIYWNEPGDDMGFVEVEQSPTSGK